MILEDANMWCLTHFISCVVSVEGMGRGRVWWTESLKCMHAFHKKEKPTLKLATKEFGQCNLQFFFFFPSEWLFP